MAGEGRIHGVDAFIAELAGRQHGVVASWQLTTAGIARGVVFHRLESGRLHPLHRGVYAVGHACVSLRGRMMAAALSCGPRGVVSHASSASLSCVIPLVSRWTDVTVPRPLRARSGVILHTSVLPSDEVTRVDGIPTTTVARTLLDLAAVLDARRLERCINEAEVRRLGSQLSLPDLLDRYPRRRGTGTIREILAAGRLGSDVTREELEARFRAFLIERSISLPAFNAPLRAGGSTMEVDCVWRAARLIVELDGRGAHNTDRAIERDKRRDRLLAASGWLVVRVTWRQLHREPVELERDLRRTIALRTAS